MHAGEVPGILAYVNDQPAGWCAVGPRDAFPRLESSRVARRVDDEPVWSVTCLFIAKPFRKRGLSVEFLKAVVQQAMEGGATVIEGYPVDPPKRNVPDPFVWTGLASAFVKAGFVEVARRSDTRPIMRYSTDTIR